MNEAILLFFTYPIWKIIQRIQQPGRPVFSEMSSVYSDRFGRAIISGLSIFLIISAPGIIANISVGNLNLSRPEPSWYLWLRTVRAFILCTFVPIWIATIIFNQGIAFFDPRISNTYAKSQEASPENE